MISFKTIRVFPIFFLCLLYSCSGGSEIPDEAVTFSPLDETLEVDDLTPYIEKMELIKIADDERLLFSDVAKMLVDSAGCFYILDYTGNLVTMTPEGTFYKQLSNKGRASNEYIGIVDIALTDKELIILDGPKVRFFNIEDPAQYKVIDINLKNPCDAIAPGGSGKLYLFSAFPENMEDDSKEKDYLLYELYTDGEIKAASIRRTDCTFSMSNISQSCGNTYYLRPQNNLNIFYKLENRAPRAAYRIDFQDKNIPDRYFYESAGEDIMTYMLADYYKLPMDLHETKSHLYFHASGPDASDCIFIYDRQSHSGIRWSNFPGEINVPVPVLSSDDDWFYAVYPEVDSTFEAKGDPLYESIVSELKESNAGFASGPYIVKIKFKKW